MADENGTSSTGQASVRAISALRELYAGLDADLARLQGECRACGRCCTFPPDGPVLYATLLERELLALVPPEHIAPSRGACPYMHPETMVCEARERRTLGCRTHFCEGAIPSPSDREAAHGMNERALSTLRETVRECGMDWDYAPVVAWLLARFGPVR